MIEVALELIKTGKSNPDHIDKAGCTALIWTCQPCLEEVTLEEVALELLKTGHSNHAQVDKKGYTALIWACRTGMKEVALKLIKMGQSFQ